MESISTTKLAQEITLSNGKIYIYDISVSGYAVGDDESNYTDIFDVEAYISEVWVVLVNEDKDCERVDKPEIIEEIESNLDLEDILRNN
jgi:hypothetical protein